MTIASGLVVCRYGRDVRSAQSAVQGIQQERTETVPISGIPEVPAGRGDCSNRAAGAPVQMAVLVVLPTLLGVVMALAVADAAPVVLQL